MKRIASLDSPFAEEVISRFLRYWGRLGTPDLDISLVLQQLMTQGQSALGPEAADEALNPAGPDETAVRAVSPDFLG